MEYSNPKVPEGINVGSEHPLKEFAQLLLGLGFLFAVGSAVLAWSASWVAPWVPFEMETRLAASYEGMLPASGAAGDEKSALLQQLAERLTASRPLPDGMRLRVHLVEGPGVNAMATVGGYIFVFRGLLDEMPNENALAMILAHEIAHIRHRDPIVALGRSAAIGLAFAALGLSTGQNAASSALSQAGLLTVLTFNREQESEADREGLAMLAELYGHVGGADAAFESLLDKASFDERFLPELWRTHPGTKDRIARLHELAKDASYKSEGPLTPLPDALRKRQKEVPASPEAAEPRPSE